MKLTADQALQLSKRLVVAPNVLKDELAAVGIEVLPPVPTTPGKVFTAKSREGGHRHKFIVEESGKLLCWEGISDGLPKSFNQKQFNERFEVQP